MPSTHQCEDTGPGVRRGIHVGIGLACILVAGACQGSGLSVDDVRERGFLRAGYSDEAPYAYLDSDGRVVGESPHALRAAASLVGVEQIRWARMDFAELVPALQQGRIDVIASGMYRTPERSRVVRFSRPTVCSRPALIVRKGDSGPQSIDDLLSGGTGRVAVLTGSVEERAFRKMGVSSTRLLTTPDVRTALAALDRSEADVLAISEPTARWTLLDGSGDDLRVVVYDPPGSVADILVACSALAFRHADTSFFEALDSALARVMADPDYQRRLDSLGFGPVPADRTDGEDP